MNFISFTLEDYHQPDTHFVRATEVKNPRIIEEIKRKAAFDKVDENEALGLLSNKPNVSINNYPSFIYLYRTRAGKMKYGINKNGETVFF